MKIKSRFYATPFDEMQHLCKRIRLRYEGEEDSETRQVRIIDPCCGAGEALRMIADTLREQGTNVTTYGVELEETRFKEASQVLDHVIHDSYENLRTNPMFSLSYSIS